MNLPDSQEMWYDNQSQFGSDFAKIKLTESSYTNLRLLLHLMILLITNFWLVPIGSVDL